MKKYRVSVEGTFCRDVFLQAENVETAKKKALEADWDEDDWCEGHSLEVTNVVETDDDWEELN